MHTVNTVVVVLEGMHRANKAHAYQLQNNNHDLRPKPATSHSYRHNDDKVVASRMLVIISHWQPCEVMTAFSDRRASSSNISIASCQCVGDDGILAASSRWQYEI